MSSVTLTFPTCSSIGTHDGTFHCDEAFACWLLKQLPEFQAAEIVRTRDAKLLDSLPIVVDVGSVYDPAKGRFDHHQRGFSETLSSEHTMKLSSAGLIFKHFGRRVVEKFATPAASQDEIERIYQRVYRGFVESLDAIDNGINQYPADIKPLYRESTHLSARIGRLNPEWNEHNINITERFHRAMNTTGEEFSDFVRHQFHAWLPARQIVLKALNQRMEYHSSGKIMVLHEHTVWKGHLLDLEAEMGIEQILYVLYPDQGGKWRVQAVPLEDSGFLNRKPLPEPWRGIRDEDLSKLSGIPGCIFVHASGFIGGAQSFESAKAMAIAAVEWKEAGKEENEQKKQKIADN